MHCSTERKSSRAAARLCGALIAALAFAPAHATDYIWCVLQDIKDGENVGYYSEVFAGDYMDDQVYESAFWSFIDARIGLGVSPSVTCSWEDSYSQARAVRDDFAARSSARDYWTDWTY